MTPEEINRMIAEWVGCEPKFMSVNGVTYDQHCEPFPKDYYGSNAAMDLLGVLVERRYSFKINGYVTTQFQVFIYCVTDDELPLETVSIAVHSTIPAAICTAILELIEREKSHVEM